MTSEILEALENISIDADVAYDALIRIVSQIDNLKDIPDLSPSLERGLARTDRVARMMCSLVSFFS